jgi:hypothetical protein
MTRKLEDFKITEKIIQQGISKASHVLELIGEYVNLSQKVRSEIVSGVMEKELAKLLSKELNFSVKPAASDMEPDLQFTGFPDKNSVEIKVAYMPKGQGKWRGGSFSKRDAPHLLIARNTDLSRIYVAFLHMGPRDWISPSNEGNEEQNYYAHTISKKELLERHDKIELFGNIQRVLKKDGTPSKMIKMLMIPFDYNKSVEIDKKSIW